ncbi:hypothetical protein K490DRAFT_62000 [Saccharata proteae CBS 121410]|uniref:Ribosomal protein L34 n=1 Tax=Saccharata proteae CBS 121410 TaxID=1314787 RepID=A0A9P4I2H5_9PEZI|nr:hypothetical protein K490DRAFT_62000 [Saccharata proteae CBS 121410]
MLNSSASKTLNQFRPFSILTPRRPALLSAPPPPPPTTTSATTTTLSAEPLLDLVPKISTHPAMQGTQVRCGPRDTFKPTNLVRKRRHGFLSRAKRRYGKVLNKPGMRIIKRRKAKGRNTLSH